MKAFGLSINLSPQVVSIRMVGVIGNRPRADVIDRASGREVWVVLVRQGVIEPVVVGEIVNVIV